MGYFLSFLLETRVPSGETRSLDRNSLEKWNYFTLWKYPRICPQYCRRTCVVDPAVNIISVENPAETRWRVDYPAGTLFRLASSPTFSAKRVVRTEVRWRWRQCRPAKTNRNRTNIFRQWYFICLQRRVRTKTTMTFPFLSRRDSIPRRRNTIHRPRERNSNRKPKKHCFRSTDHFNRFSFHSSSDNGRFYSDFVSHLY